MKFTKMHGTGNDYIYIDCFKEGRIADPAALATRLSHRHFGVGGDGLILIKPATDGADVTMEMFNSDGSKAEMCGNGLRCVVKYVFDRGIVKSREMKVLTGAGILVAKVAKVRGGIAEEVELQMGRPILEGLEIPTTWDVTPVVNSSLVVDGKSFGVTCVSMGNPHCVIYVEDVTAFPVQQIGPLIENDPHFPRRVNVEFVETVSPTEVRQRTWERGAGETWACGTGAAAVCVAGHLTGRTHRKLLVHLKGGDLRLSYGEDGEVVLTGPAEEVYQGEIN
jgi:diaminopimelate epimerase